MKTFKTIIATVAILFGTLTVNAQSMSYEAMRSNARFLTDRMAYELGIRSMSIIDDIYRINLDYILGVNECLDEIALGYYYDDYMDVCARRDYALRSLLGDIVWNRVLGYSYFYRPIVFANHRWHFSIYDYDRYGVHHYFYSAPRHYNRNYKGGHFFRGMAPAGGHVMQRSTPQPRRDGMNNNRPQGGVNNGNNGGNRPQGGVNNGNNGGNRPQGGVNNGNVNGGNRPQGGVNNGNNGGNRPQGGNVDNNRPSNTGVSNGNGNRSQNSSATNRSTTSGRSENNARSSSRSNTSSSSSRSNASSSSSRSSSRSVSTPSRSGSSSGSSARGGGSSSSSSSRGGNSSHSGGSTRSGRR